LVVPDRRGHGLAREDRADDVPGAAVGPDRYHAAAQAGEDRQHAPRVPDARRPAVGDRRRHAELVAEVPLEERLDGLVGPRVGGPLPVAAAVAEAAEHEAAVRQLLVVLEAVPAL